MLWEPFDLLTHVLHLALGFGAAGAAVVALSARKGGRLHRRAGWVFAAGMLIAAVTAWLFMIARPLPLAMIEATIALYALGTAILALHPRWRGARTGEWALFALLCLVMLGIGATAVRLHLAGTPLIVAPAAFFVILAYFAALDLRYLRAREVARLDRVRRHALRMALAVSETVRAPTITFADELGLPIPAIVFGSFLLVPLIYFAFAPAARRAAAGGVAAPAG
ncbi:MAG: hypothetical protein ACT4N8_03615 [Sphingosinicella sp.]|uniref:hypothetical protein n=1 Tax=Sphingosinicella sp. TaxID=1917971 RepID=UPI004037D518